MVGFDEELKSKIVEIADFYGPDTELRQLSEECCELGAEANKCIRKGVTLTSNLISEIADVLIVASEIVHLFGITQEQLDTELEYKVNRQLGRIKLIQAQKRSSQ